MTNYKTDIVTFPGRVRSWQANQEAGLDDLLPYSCKLRKYKNNLLDELTHTSKDLRWGAGVKLVLDDYHPEPALQKEVEWKFYLAPEHPDIKKITPHQQQYFVNSLASVKNYCHISVADTMDECPLTGFSIEESWEVFANELKEWAALDFPLTVVVDLSALRPSGQTNGRGLTSTGPVGDGTEASNTASFVAIYEYLAKYLHAPSIENFLCLFGVLNNTLRRGGLYKNGIITSSMWYENINFVNYLDFPLTEIPGSHKKGVRLDENILKNEGLCSLVREKIRDESLFVENVSKDDTSFPNVCVSGETWVDTTEGSTQVKDLVGVPFVALLDGKQYKSVGDGFWSSGVQPTVKLKTQAGLELRCTADHEVIRGTRTKRKEDYKEEWVAVGSLQPGDWVKLANNQQEWSGSGTFDEGWLIGNLIGDGFFLSNNAASLQFFGDGREALQSVAYSYLEALPPILRKGTTNTEYPIGRSEDIQVLYKNEPFRTTGGRRLGNLAALWGLSKENKHNLKLCEQLGSSAFWCGLISGLFDADACVTLGRSDGSGKAIQFTQNKKHIVDVVVRVLQRLGIHTSVYPRPAATRTIRGVSYEFQAAYRVDIGGQRNLALYRELIGFKHPSKAARLESVLSGYKLNVYNLQPFTRVVEVVQGELEEVFDCTIEDVHAFAGNGLAVSNCEGLFVPDNGTCLIGRINLGQCVELSDIPKGYRQLATELTTLHMTWRDKHPDKARWSAPLEEDQQIGLDVMGLANLLRIHGVTYSEFIKAIKTRLKEIHHEQPVNIFMRDKPLQIVDAIYEGMFHAVQASDAVCAAYGQAPLKRIFTVEPAQSHSYETVDADGFTTCRGIWPPLAKRVVRDSESQKGKHYRHGNVETINDLSEDAYEKLNELFYRLMKCTGRAHAISYDLRREPTKEWFERFVTDKKLPTKYYTEIVSTKQRDFLQKNAQLAVSEQEACSLENKDACALCEE